MKRYFQNIWLGVYTVLVGMKVTLSHLFTRAVTIQYPDVKLQLPERARNRLYVNMDDCIGCDQCAKACPVDCITIETAKALPTEDLGTTSTGHKKRLWVTQFDIDIAKCCYCGLCVYPCPTECIKMTDVYEFSEYDRQNLIYSFATLTPEEAAQKKAQAERYEKEQSAKRAATAAQKAAAPGAGQPKPAQPAVTQTTPKPEVSTATTTKPEPAVVTANPGETKVKG